jgi:hypothetical protein
MLAGMALPSIMMNFDWFVTASRLHSRLCPNDCGKRPWDWPCATWIHFLRENGGARWWP